MNDAVGRSHQPVSERAASSRRKDETRSGSARPAASASSSPHSGSPSPCVQPRGQSSVSSSRSGNASIRSSGWTWARPNERMPGVSMIQPSLVGQRQHERRRRGVPPASGDRVDHADVAVRAGHQRVDQRRLPDAAGADQHAGAPVEALAQLGEVAAALGHQPRHAERAVRREQRLGVGQVGLGQAQQRLHAGVVRRHQGAVDQPRLRLGVGQRGHHDELLGVGDDHPLDRVVVVGGAPQRGDPRS